MRRTNKTTHGFCKSSRVQARGGLTEAVFDFLLTPEENVGRSWVGWGWWRGVGGVGRNSATHLAVSHGIWLCVQRLQVDSWRLRRSKQPRAGRRERPAGISIS